MIPAVGPGIRLYMRNRHLEELKAVSADKILLFVHRATCPVETAFGHASLRRRQSRGEPSFDAEAVGMRGAGGPVAGESIVDVRRKGK